MSKAEGKEGESKEERSLDSNMDTLVRSSGGSTHAPLSAAAGLAGFSESKEGDNGMGESAASRLTSSAPTCVEKIVLKFTTLSDGNEQASFVVGPAGGSVGRSSRGENVVFVPSDATLAPVRHAAIERSSGSGGDGRFWLLDCATSDHRAAVRVGVGHAAREWPLTLGAAFSAGNSVFEVVSVSVGDGGAKGSTDDGQPRLELLARTGPKRGSTIAVTVGGCTMGRANDNTLCIPDKELSRKHSKVGFSPASQGGGQFFVSDMGSTNGTYVQLVGPYAGKYPLHLNDHILIGRTGFSVNRWDFGVSEEMGLRRTMEDKSIVVQDIVVPELDVIAVSGGGGGGGQRPQLPDSGVSSLLKPQTWLAVYDGHGGDEASTFLQKRLHLEVSLSLARAAPKLIPAAAAVAAAAARGAGGAGGASSASSSSASSSSMAWGPYVGEGPLSGAQQAMDSVVEEALMEAFVATDGDFLASGGQAGSTASTVLVLGNRAYCGNVGDSRTVLCRTAEEGGGGGGRGGSSLSVHAVALSEDHKPTREDEAARIKAAGGFIINKRVMGELAVSRAFGDAEFKKGISEILGEAGDSSTGLKRATSTAGRDSNDGDDDYDGGESKQDLSKPLVVAEPEVKCVTLYPSEIPVCAPGGGGGGGGQQQQQQQRFRDEFLLLACDGLFDVMSNQEAVEYAREQIIKHDGDAQKAAEAMTKRAIDDLGSRDNVTVLLVLLQDMRQRRPGGGGASGGGGGGHGGSKR